MGRLRRWCLRVLGLLRLELKLLEILTADYTNEVLHRLRSKGPLAPESDVELFWPLEYFHRHLQADLLQSARQDKTAQVGASAGKLSLHQFLLEYELTELFTSETGAPQETSSHRSCEHCLRNALCRLGLDQRLPKIQTKLTSRHSKRLEIEQPAQGA